MPRTFSCPCICAAACALLMLACCAPLQAATQQQVLVLNSYDESTTPYARTRSAFMAELQRRMAEPVAFRQFDLQERGYEAAVSEELKAELLRAQYADSPPGLVVAIGPPAIAFWLAQRDRVFPATPLIAATSQYALAQFELRPGDTAVVTRFSFAESVGGILGLLPGTTRILMVFGASAYERSLAEQSQIQLANAFDGLAIEYTNDLDLRQLQQRLAALPPDATVFYGIFDSDVNGVLMQDHSGLVFVRAASSVPVFSPFEDQLGMGIVGGRLIQLERVGKEIAATAERILSGKLADHARTVVDASEPVYDWRELQAWDIDLSRLPPGSTLRFKPPAFWREYFGWFLFALFVIVAETLLVGALLVQRRRRREAEFASDSLGSRLITAHEDERRRIARELHDDLSQRLARLSIDVSYVAANPASETARGVLETLHPDLVRISADIHDMSYRLHPSLVDDLGIAAALRTECDRVRRQSGTSIVEKIGEVRERVPRDVALGLYRIAQEAMHNAIKHARAETIEVSLQRDAHLLMLTVRDNGIGFDAAKKSVGQGLGLSSMRERARLAHGSFNVRSRPGKGTAVIAVVPLEGGAA